MAKEPFAARLTAIIIQMGDFCMPKEENRHFLDIFNSFKGPRYHVIGNHDTDGGFAKEDTVKYYGMPSRYYSFDQNNFHFIVLDGTVGPYPWTPEPDQVNWLQADLSATLLPTIIFIHQPLENEEVISNADLIRSILEKSGKKVIGCFGGHRHMDYMKVVNDIPYFQINSMSYFWMGPKFVRSVGDPAMDQKFPAMKYFTRYKDPLFCFVKVSKKGRIEIEGRSSVFIDGTPGERGYSFETVLRDEVTAAITKRVYPE